MPKPTAPVLVLVILTTLAGLVLGKDIPGKCDLYGRIPFVQAFPDVKVQVVKAFPDIRVQKVADFPDKPGKWQIVDSFPNWKVQIVDDFPGCE